MKEEQEKEMLHLKKLLERLQRTQLALYGNRKVTMEISLSSFMFGITVSVFTNVDMFSTACGDVKTFRMCVHDKAKHNENICNGIIRYIQKHSA